MGDVHLARPFDLLGGLPTPLVVKRLHSELAERAEFVRRFRHEAEMAIAVDDPCVARLYDVGSVGTSLYLALEYVPGWPVSKVLADLWEFGQAPPTGFAVRIICDALQGLAALHSASDRKTGEVLGAVHRDLSPRNLIVRADGRAQLIDFGLGKSKLKDWKTRTGAVLGSHGYMAPEQVLAGAVDQRTDVYAAAAILFELLTLRPYIERGSIPEMLTRQSKPTFVAPTSLRKELPGALDGVLAKALSIDADQRYESASDFRRALLAAAPEANEPFDPQSPLGARLVADVAASQAEVERIVDADSPDPEPKVRTAVFVRKAGIAPVTPEAAAPSPPSEGARPPSLWLPVASCAVGIIAGIAIDRAVLAFTAAPESPVSESGGPDLAATPGTPTEATLPSKRERPSKPASTPERRPTRRTVERASKTPETAPKNPARPEPLEWSGLIQRAMSLVSKFSESPPNKRAAQSVLNQINGLGLKGGGTREEYQELDREVARLEQLAGS